MRRLAQIISIWLLIAVPAICFAQQEVPVPPAPVGDPNYYGQVDMVDNAPPPVIYSTPVMVQPAPVGVIYPPVYLRVPPVYYQNWPMYCGYYNACFYPVFFVQDSWYLNWYGPWYHRYYPYGRPGFVARVYFQPHYGGRGGYPPRGGPGGGYHGGWHAGPGPRR